MLRNGDPWLIAALLALMTCGVLLVASATRYDLSGLIQFASWTQPSALSFVQRQLVWIGIGLAAIAVCQLFDYRALMRWANIIYVLSLGLLVLVLVTGDPDPTGSDRWLNFGPVQLQPSEFAKLAFIIALASLLSRREETQATSGTDLAYTLLYLVPPLGLIIKQPDLGTALVMLGIMAGVLFMAGMPMVRFIILCLGGISAALIAVLLKLYFDAPIPLAKYQLKRLIIFLNPGSDPFGHGYQTLQSQYAIGSGGLTGQGLFRGDQIGLNFLPERHTDFIFSVAGEELGFAGASVIILLALLLLLRVFNTAATAKDRFGSLLVTGIGSMLAFHIVVNIGMTIGVMPVTGVPLPFVSYGGSALLTNCIAIGLVLNVHMRRHKLLFGS